MTVKYLGRKYHVNLSDKLYIEYQKTVLFLKRQKRRMKLLFSKEDIFLYSIITVCWCLFGCISWAIGQIKEFENMTYTVLDMVWELREPFFSSVILAFAINAFDRVKAHINKMDAQHSTYVTALSDFQRCVEHYVGQERQYFHPFYCRKTLDDTINYIKSKPNVSVPKLLTVRMRVNLTLILERLEKVREEFIRGNIITYATWFELLYMNIDSARGIITEILISDTFTDKRLIDLSKTLFSILNCMREPWRVDVQRNIRLLTCLDKYSDNGVSDDFYFRMLLHGYRIKGTHKVAVTKIER